MSEHISAGMVKDLITSIEGMQRKVDALERKIDMLVKKSQSGTSRGDRPSRPRNENDRSSRPAGRKFEGKKEEVSSEGKFYNGSPFGKKKDGGKGGMKRGKKSFAKLSKGSRGKR
jgi:hypothetical protein